MYALTTSGRRRLQAAAALLPWLGTNMAAGDTLLWSMPGACAGCHVTQVAELEGLFGGLRADVEALFMQAPSSDLHSLYERAQRERLVLDEQVHCLCLCDGAGPRCIVATELAKSAAGQRSAAAAAAADLVVHPQS